MYFYAILYAMSPRENFFILLQHFFILLQQFFIGQILFLLPKTSKALQENHTLEKFGRTEFSSEIK